MDKNLVQQKPVQYTPVWTIHYMCMILSFQTNVW